MAAQDIKLTELPEINISDLDNTDLLYIVDNNSISKNVPLGTIKQDFAKDFVDVMQWKGEYVPNGSYLKNEAITAQGWSMVAKTNTAEQPVPQAIGQLQKVYDGAETPATDNAKMVMFGTRYTFPVSGWFSSFRVYTHVGYRYEVFAIIDPNGDRKYRKLTEFTAKNLGWEPLATNTVLFKGNDTIDFLVIERSSTAGSTFSGNWDYKKPALVTVPANGEVMQSDADTTQLLVHKIDNLSNDRTAELATIVVGDVIRVSNSVLSILTVTDSGLYYTYTVSPSVQEQTEEVKLFSFESVTASDLPSVIDTDYNLGNPNLRGLKIVDGSITAITPDDNQYGFDLFVQEALLPTDWDLISYDFTPTNTIPEKYVLPTKHFDPVYLFNKQTEVIIPSTTYSLIGQLLTPEQDAATYAVALAMTYSLNVTTRSAYFRFSTDGGVTWNEFRREPKDNTDRVTLYYSFSVPLPVAQVMDIRVEGRKENVGDILNVHFLDIIWEKKLSTF